MAAALPLRFFFYGTLMGGHGNAGAQVVAAHMRLLGAARAPGRLVGLEEGGGWYPALLPDAGGGQVAGRLYEALPGFGAAQLAAIDRYELCFPEDPGVSEYCRALVPVAWAGGQGEAQAYLYARALPPGALPIAGGDFARWLADTGRRAFGAAG
ncbi:MAG TPA: gamma-glutamylcyclotransferase family protein [Novosphingobium sp.]|nr:gamma-glutamylcyclotransferase family protein [Novosphingobium sp.]